MYDRKGNRTAALLFFRALFAFFGAVAYFATPSAIGAAPQILSYAQTPNQQNPLRPFDHEFLVTPSDSPALNLLIFSRTITNNFLDAASSAIAGGFFANPAAAPQLLSIPASAVSPGIFSQGFFLLTQVTNVESLNLQKDQPVVRNNSAQPLLLIGNDSGTDYFDVSFQGTNNTQVFLKNHLTGNVIIDGTENRITDLGAPNGGEISPCSLAIEGSKNSFFGSGIALLVSELRGNKNEVHPGMTLDLQLLSGDENQIHAAFDETIIWSITGNSNTVEFSSGGYLEELNGAGNRIDATQTIHNVDITIGSRSRDNLILVSIHPETLSTGVAVEDPQHAFVKRTDSGFIVQIGQTNAATIIGTNVFFRNILPEHFR